MKKLMAIVVSALCAAVAFTSSAEVWNIPAPGGVGDVAALETALTSHATGDEIVLAAGTYSFTKTLSNKDKVAVTVRGATGDPKDVILDGQGQVRCLNLTGKSTHGQSLCFPPNAADRVILKDVTIANGMQRDVTDVNCSPGGGSDTVGAGGVYLRYGFVENCVFTNCQARAETTGLNASGGALFARIAFVTNCTFVACEAYSLDRAVRGGAICGISGGSNETYTPADLRFLSCRAVNGKAVNSAIVTGGAAFFPFPATGDSGTIISKLVFVDCVATNTAGWKSSYHPNGGGLYYSSNIDTLTFTDCVFSNCLSYGEGGGFWAGGPCAVSNCTFVGNSTVNSYGGGLHAHKGVTVENCIFKDNTSNSQGGGISADGGKLMVRHSCFDKNKSLISSGGAIYASLGVDAEDCVFRSNDAMATSGSNIGGGAICMAANTSEDCLIDRCFFQGNTSPRPSASGSTFRGGAAIYLNASKAGSGVFVRNSVFAGNSGGPVFAVADCVTGEPPTWENGAGFYVQNCTITNNIGATQGRMGSRAIFDGATDKDSAWQGLFVENCAINGNTDFADGVFFSNFVNNGCLATQVRNCASDVTTAFPEYGTNGNIAWQKKLKNLGYNSSWITAESMDGGDGTWTEQSVGIYGYYVAANGVNPRCRSDHPAIGAQEPRNFGLMLIFW